MYFSGKDPGFQVRGGGGGGGAFKKIAQSGGRREICFGISCEKSRFYAKKSYFFHLRRETRTFLGYFVWKIAILRQKIIFFQKKIGGGGGGAHLDPPLLLILVHSEYLFVVRLSQSNVAVYWTRKNTPLSFWINVRCPSVINMILLYLITRRHYKL